MTAVPSWSLPGLAVRALPAGAARITFAREGQGPRAGRTRVTELAARSPTRLLTPKNHGTGAWVFASSLGGGLVDGDALAFAVTVEAGALGLLGTQASTKVYRSPRGTSQTLVARVAGGGTFVSLPDPVACFAEARYAARTEIHLEEGASVALVEAFTAGRTAHGERWAFRRYETSTRIYSRGVLVARESMVLDPDHGPIAARFGAMDAFATVLVLGPAVSALAAGVLAAAPPADRGAELFAQASPLPGGEGVVLRAAATGVEALATFVRRALGALPALLGDDPYARKW